MIESAPTHIAFADESNWNRGRYRSISLVSARLDDARRFHHELNSLRKSHGKSEYKWSDTRERHGIALAGYFFSRQDKIRVDVLIWDIEDSRHGGLRNRDDKANFARMYYHLIHNVLKRRWPDNARWLICPDSQKQIDWLTMERCLAWKSWAVEINLFDQLGNPDFQKYYCIEEIREVCSKTNLLIQLADLFAGLGAYSYLAFNKYQRWKQRQEGPLLAFEASETDVGEAELSSSDHERLPILDYIRNEAAKYGLQLSLDSSGGLSTKNPARTLNFWLYRSQRKDDRAPIRPR